MPMSENKRRAMPLLTLDPNKPPSRSPHKRATPPQSPPTPHKIELIDDDHRNRLLRSSKTAICIIHILFFKPLELANFSK